MIIVVEVVEIEKKENRWFAGNGDVFMMQHFWQFKTGIKQINSRRKSGSLLPGGEVRILGRKYHLVLKKRPFCRIELTGDQFIICTHGGSRTKEYQRMFELWRGRMLRDYCSEIISRQAKQFPDMASIPEIRVRKKVRTFAGYGKLSGTIFVSPEIYGFSEKSIRYILACQLIAMTYGEDQLESWLTRMFGDLSPYLFSYENDIAEFLLESFPGE